MSIYVGLGMKNSKETAELYQKAFGLTLGEILFKILTEAVSMPSYSKMESIFSQ